MSFAGKVNNICNDYYSESDINLYSLRKLNVQDQDQSVRLEHSLVLFRSASGFDQVSLSWREGWRLQNEVESKLYDYIIIKLLTVIYA